MSELFLKFLNISINASWLGLAVILLRIPLKKAPRFFTVILWALVGIRLICPISLESPVSMIPSTETVPEEIITSPAPEINSGVLYLNYAVNPIITEKLTPTPEVTVSPIEKITTIASVVWICGIFVMGMYIVLSYLFVRRKVRESIRINGNIYECDRIPSPFILGIIRPRIFIPSDTDKSDIEYIIAHETAHIKRLDHLWKPLGFIILSVYWFNPVLWAVYILLCRDIEVSCDEKVLKSLGGDIKKGYSEALINSSIPRRMISACPLAFGEVGVKARVKNILNYKKPAFWLIAVSLIICIAVGVFFLTDPLGNDTELDPDIEEFIIGELSEPSRDHGEVFKAVSLDVLDVKRKGEFTTVYAWVFTKSYDGTGEEVSGSHIPSVITVKKDGDGFILEEYWLPDDGNGYADSIREKFPRRLHSKALGKGRASELETECDTKAEKYFNFLNDSNIQASMLGCNTNVNGVDILLTASSLTADVPYITLEWLNGSDYDITYGDVFTLEYLDGNEYTNAITDNKVFHLIAYGVKPGERQSHTYYLDGCDLSKIPPAVYRFETKFSCEGEENTKKYTATITFQITGSETQNMPIDLVSPNGIAYVFKNSPDLTMPRLVLDPYNHNCTFIYSVFSSYMGIATYEESDGQLTVHTNDGLNTWYFDKVGDTLVFDGDRSSPIPSYRYEANGQLICPVPDGAVFEPITVEDYGITAFNSAAVFDIDDDGNIETIVSYPGPLSGLFSLHFTVLDGDKVGHQEIAVFTESGKETLFVNSDRLFLLIDTTGNHAPGVEYDPLVYYEVTLKDDKLNFEKTDPPK